MTQQTEKAPAYQWYPRDFAADEPVVLMTLEEAYPEPLTMSALCGYLPIDEQGRFAGLVRELIELRERRAA